MALILGLSIFIAFLNGGSVVVGHGVGKVGDVRVVGKQKLVDIGSGVVEEYRARSRGGGWTGHSQRGGDRGSRKYLHREGCHEQKHAREDVDGLHLDESRMTGVIWNIKAD